MQVAAQCERRHAGQKEDPAVGALEANKPHQRAPLAGDGAVEIPESRRSLLASLVNSYLIDKLVNIAIV